MVTRWSEANPATPCRAVQADAPSSPIRRGRAQDTVPRPRTRSDAGRGRRRPAGRCRTPSARIRRRAAGTSSARTRAAPSAVTMASDDPSGACPWRSVAGTATPARRAAEARQHRDGDAWPGRPGHEPAPTTTSRCPSPVASSARRADPGTRPTSQARTSGRPAPGRAAGARPGRRSSSWLRGVSVRQRRRGAGRGDEPLGLVLYFRGDLLEFRLELAAVVGAEEQFTAATGRRAGMPGRRSGRSGQQRSAGSRVRTVVTSPLL